MLEIRHLQLVRAVAEEGSLTRAAERLHLTQSALSHQLRDAERALKRPLFTRNHRKMELTAAGRDLLESARKITAELESVETRIRAAAGPAEGSLRLATECYTCYHWLPSALEPFHRAHPGVDVQIVVEATREPIPALLAGKIDLAVVSDPVRNARVRLDPLFADELVVAVPSGHRLARAAFVAAEDFEGENLITYAAPREHLTIFSQILKPAGIAPRRWMPMELTEAILELVRARQGISVLARWAAAPAVRSGAVVVRRLTRAGVMRQWSAATLRNRRRSAHLDRFIQALAASQAPRRGGLTVAV